MGSDANTVPGALRFLQDRSETVWDTTLTVRKGSV